MSKVRYVLDASALLALLFREPGAERVEAVLNGASISAANWSEVVSKLIDKGLPASEVLHDLGELDIVIVPASREHAELAGTMRETTQSSGLGLGDRICLALGIHANATVLTSDRIWATLGFEQPVIELIR
ncbi:MAG: type II toxin-antitoxin system VapC family toxin [Pseudomonadota bacterium]|nr:type II toxin-antitoxin system VapC family toxin [Pseudomonadota bacterium]